jgi:hypothetical protein
MRTASIALVLFCVAAFAPGAYGAYTRTEAAGTYVQRTGAPTKAMSTSNVALRANPTADIADLNGMLIALPFTFNYFDRAYNYCWMTTRGRVTFSEIGLDDPVSSNLTPPVTNAASRNTIHCIGTRLSTHVRTMGADCRVYFESGRVVFQWTNVSSFQTHVWFSFQIHLLQNGNIELHCGPEFRPTAWTFSIGYVSGLVNLDGTEAAAGFNNSTAVQLTPPALGTSVTFTPAFTAADTVVIEPPAFAFADPMVNSLPANNVPVLPFRLRALGTGLTVNALAFGHLDVTGATTATFALVRDTAPLGQYNGESALGTVTTTNTTTVVSGLTEAITSGLVVNYLLVCTVTGLAYNEQRFECRTVSGSAAASPAGITGGCVTGRCAFCIGPKIIIQLAKCQPAQSPFRVGDAYNNLLSFRMALEPLYGVSATLNSLTLDLLTAGFNASQAVDLRLYRDNGTPGELDAADVQLSTTQAGPAPVVFGGLSETATTAGQNYLITFDVSAGANTSGTIAGSITATTATPAAMVDFVGGTYYGNLMLVAASATEAVAWRNERYAITFFPAQPGDSNVTAMSFLVASSTGSIPITALSFGLQSGATTGVAAARLYRDNGTFPGLYDAGDTQLTALTTITATNINFGSIVGLSATTTDEPLLVVVDFLAGATTGIQLNFVDSASLRWDVPVQGTIIAMGTGVAQAGVDVSINVPATNLSIDDNESVLFATASFAARGAGGVPPTINFQAVAAAGGWGSYYSAEVYLDLGTVGQLDAADYLIRSNFSGFNFACAGSSAVVTAGTTRNYLIFLRRSTNGLNVGTGLSVFRGVSNGTNARLMLPATPYPAIELTSSAGTPGGGGGGDDGSGCSTAASNARVNYALLAGVLGLMLLGVRTRRLRA